MSTPSWKSDSSLFEAFKKATLYGAGVSGDLRSSTLANNFLTNLKSVNTKIALMCTRRDVALVRYVRYAQVPDELVVGEYGVDIDFSLDAVCTGTPGKTSVQAVELQRKYLVKETVAGKLTTVERWQSVKAVPPMQMVAQTKQCRIVFSVSLDTSIYGAYSFNVNFRYKTAKASYTIGTATIAVGSAAGELDSCRFIVNGKSTDRLKSGERFMPVFYFRAGDGFSVYPSTNENSFRLSVKFGDSYLKPDADGMFTAPTVTERKTLEVMSFVDAFNVVMNNKKQSIVSYSNGTPYNLDTVRVWSEYIAERSSQNAWWSDTQTTNTENKSTADVLSIYTTLLGQDNTDTDLVRVAYSESVDVLPNGTYSEIDVVDVDGIGYAYPERLLVPHDKETGTVYVRCTGSDPVLADSDGDSHLSFNPGEWKLELKPDEGKDVTEYTLHTNNVFKLGSTLDFKTGATCSGINDFYAALRQVVTVSGAKTRFRKDSFELKLAGIKNGDVGTVESKPFIVDTDEDLSELPSINLTSDYDGSLYFAGINLNGGALPPGSILVSGKTSSGDYAYISNVYASNCTVRGAFCKNCSFDACTFYGHAKVAATDKKYLNLPSIEDSLVVNCKGFDGGKISRDSSSCSAMFKNCQIKMSYFNGADSDLFEYCVLEQSTVFVGVMEYFNKGGVTTGCVFDLVHGLHVYINKPEKVKLVGETRTFYPYYTYIGVDEPIDDGSMTDCSVTRCMIDYVVPDEETLNKNDWVVVKSLDRKNNNEIGETTYISSDEQKRAVELDDLLKDPQLRYQLACAANVPLSSVDRAPAADIYDLYLAAIREWSALVRPLRGKTELEIVRTYGADSSTYAFYIFMSPMLRGGALYASSSSSAGAMQMLTNLCYYKQNQAEYSRVAAEIKEQEARRAEEERRRREETKAALKAAADARREEARKRREEAERLAKKKQEEQKEVKKAPTKERIGLCCFNGSTGNIHRYTEYDVSMGAKCPKETTGSSSGKETSYGIICDSSFAAEKAQYAKDRAAAQAKYQSLVRCIKDAYGHDQCIGPGGCWYVTQKAALQGTTSVNEYCNDNGTLRLKTVNGKAPKTAVYVVTLKAGSSSSTTSTKPTMSTYTKR